MSGPAGTSAEHNYDYAGQDPINSYDLSGKSFWSCAKHPIRCGKAGVRKTKNAIGRRYCNAISQAFAHENCPPPGTSGKSAKSKDASGCENHERLVGAILIVGGAYLVVVGGIAYEGIAASYEAAVASGENLEAVVSSAHILLGPAISAMGLGEAGWGAYYESC